MADVADQLLELAGADLELVTDPELVRPVDVPVLRGDAGPLARRHRVGAVHPARDNARRRPLLVGGGLTASVVGRRGVPCLGLGVDEVADLAPHLAGLLPGLGWSAG